MVATPHPAVSCQPHPRLAPALLRSALPWVLLASGLQACGSSDSMNATAEDTSVAQPVRDATATATDTGAVLPSQNSGAADAPVDVPLRPNIDGPGGGGASIDAGVSNGGAVDGGAVDGGAVDGGAVDGGAVDSPAVNGSGVDGAAVDGAEAVGCPPCVAAIVADCVPEGTCVVADIGSIGHTLRKCYQNGVTISSSWYKIGPGDTSSELIVTRNGQPCYQLTSTSKSFEDSDPFLLTDNRTGQSLRGLRDSVLGRVIACDGKSYLMADSCGTSAETCTPGTCP